MSQPTLVISPAPTLPLTTGMSDDALSELFLTVVESPQHHEDSSSAPAILFQTWQCEQDDAPEGCCSAIVSGDWMMMEEDVESPTCVRKVLEGLDNEVFSSGILELPPLSTSSTSPSKKRPLCTFLNFRGTRRNDSLDSIPSLQDDVNASKHPKVDSYLELEPPPKIHAKLKNDEHLKDLLRKYHRLMKEAKDAEQELKDIEKKPTDTIAPQSPSAKKRKTNAAK